MIENKAIATRESLLRRVKTLYSAEDLDSTSIMIWTR